MRPIGVGPGPRLAPGLAAAVVAVVFSGYCAVGFARELIAGPQLERHGLALVLVGAVLVVQLGYFGRPATRLRSRLTYGLLLFQAALAFGPLPLFGQSWIGIPAFFAGSLLLVVRPPITYLVLAGVAALMGFVQAELSDNPFDVAYTTLAIIVFALAVSGLTRLARLVFELHSAHAELARMAVAEERLRFARDLHDLLGLSLSAITLKGELAHRLIGEHPDRTRRELTEVLAIARRALGDVRTVAGGYAELSLEEECDSAVSMFAAAQVEVRVEREYGDLPRPVRTVLATVLREGITNVLRHSKVERCDIAVRQEGDAVTLTIVNDGVQGEVAAAPGTGSGIRNLSHRVSTRGGVLRAGLEPDHRTFRLYVSLPISAVGAEPVSDGAARQVPAPPAEAAEQAGRVEGNMPGLLIKAVLSGRFVMAVVQLLYLTHALWQVTLAAGTMAAVLALQLGHFSRVDPRAHGRLDVVLLAAQAALVYLPLALLGPVWVSLPGFVAGSALLVLSPARAWTVFAAVLISVAAIQQVYSPDPVDTVFNVAATTISALLVYGLTWLAWLVTELHTTQAELARMAVAQERLGFARNLHDLLGLSISAITLKIELIRRLMRTDSVRAQAELTEVLELSRRALADVRSVASGYRNLSEGNPVWTARTADTIIRLELRHGELPVRVRKMLVAQLRGGTGGEKEGPHRIVVRRSNGKIHLEMYDVGEDVGTVSDLVTSLGGELTTATDGAGRLRLTATFPA